MPSGMQENRLNLLVLEITEHPLDDLDTPSLTAFVLESDLQIIIIGNLFQFQNKYHRTRLSGRSLRIGFEYLV